MVTHNSHGDHDDPGYAKVHEFRQPLLTSTPRVRLLHPPDDGIVRFSTRKYENVGSSADHTYTVSTVRDTVSTVRDTTESSRNTFRPIA